MDLSLITPLILTFNEKENIGRTVGALSWAKEVLVLDSFGSDQTLQIARASHPNVRILQREFDTHTMQWNFGLDHVQTEWVLTLDADYEVSPELAGEIERMTPLSEIVGYEARFEYRINGRPLRASVYPSRVVLFRTKKASYFDDGHTQRLRPSGAVAKLSGKIYHDDRKSFRHWFNAQKKYAKLEAQHLIKRRKEKGERRKEKSESGSNLSFPDRLRLKIFFAAPAMFFYLLFGCGLILDGWPGWVYVFQRTLAEMLLSKELLIGRDR